MADAATTGWPLVATASDGGMAPGTPDRIAGGAFTVYGTFVESVGNHGQGIDPLELHGSIDSLRIGGVHRPGTGIPGRSRSGS